MAMENGEAKTIGIGGITRNTSNEAAPDGDLCEAINIRHEHGKISAVHRMEERACMAGMDVLYIHKTSTYENIIVYENGGIYAYQPEEGEDGEETVRKVVDVEEEVTTDYFEQDENGNPTGEAKATQQEVEIVEHDPLTGRVIYESFIMRNTTTTTTTTTAQLIEVLANIERADINSITHLGNVLIVATSGEMYRFLYSKADNTYTKVTLPDKLRIFAYAEDCLTTTDEIKEYVERYNDERNGGEEISYEDYWPNHLHPLKRVYTVEVDGKEGALQGFSGCDDMDDYPMGYYSLCVSALTPYCTKIDDFSDEQLQSINKPMEMAKMDGHFYNPVVIRAAVRLYDGSYVAVSDPIFVMGSAGRKAAVATKKTKYQFIASGSGKDYTNFKKGDRVTQRSYIATCLAYDINFTLLDYIEDNDEIIDGIAIFAAELPIYVNTSDTTIEELDDSSIVIKWPDDDAVQDYANYWFREKDNNTGYTSSEASATAEGGYEYNADGIEVREVYKYREKDFEEKVKNISNYYEIAFYKLDELERYKEKKLELTDTTVLDTKEALTIGDAANLTGVKGLYIYNSMLHSYGGYEKTNNIESVLACFVINTSKAVANFNFYGGENSLYDKGITDRYYTDAPYWLSEATVVVEGESDRQYTVIGKLESGYLSGSAYLVMGLSPVLMTGHATAKKMIVIYCWQTWKDGSPTEEKHYGKYEVKTTQSYTGDYAYYMSSDMELIPLSCDDNANLTLFSSVDEYEAELAKYTAGDKEDPNDTSLRVSETDNPFAFPVEKTYSFGTGEILAVCASVQPISTGQFGQYPLYVFCTDGIWSLSVGQGGETSYSSSAPVSFDVCTMPDTIMPAYGGVVYATEKGLSIVKGGTTAKLSEALDGATVPFAAAFKRLAALPDELGLEGTTDAIPFKDYLTTAKCAYNYDEEELIVFSANYNYFYALKNGMWSKRSGRIEAAVENYPNVYLRSDEIRIDPLKKKVDKKTKEEYFRVDIDEESTYTETVTPLTAYDSETETHEGYDETTVYVWYNLINETGEIMPCLLATRAIKLGNNDHKRLGRVILRSFFPDAEVRLWLFGSDDSRHFAPVGYVEGHAVNLTDLHVHRGIKPYKYYALAFGATAAEASEWELVQIDTEGKIARGGLIQP